MTSTPIRRQATANVRGRKVLYIASPKGGQMEFEGFSDPETDATQYPNDLITLGFKHHATFGKLLENTPSIDDVDVTQYDAVCVAGGGGPLITFKDDTTLHKLIADFFEAGKIVGLICHGTCLMLWTTLSNGTSLADSKTWTGHPDSEEEMMNAALGTKVNEYTIETEAKRTPTQLLSLLRRSPHSRSATVA